MTPATIAGMAALNGLRMAALTDHNSCGNLPAFFEACHAYGVLPVAGIEVESAEAVHIVCLFPKMELAMAFWQDTVKPTLPPIKNKPAIFGDQQFMNADDEVVGEEPILLINSTGLSIDEIADAARRAGGIPFPAHVDRPSNGIIEILGGFPPEPGFACVEFNDSANIPALCRTYPELGNLLTLTNSDAHRLDQINNAVNVLPVGDPAEADEVLLARLFSCLRGMGG